MSKRATFLGIALVCATSVLAETTPINVVPAVQSWTPAAGVFDAKDAGVIVLEAYSDALAATAQSFRQELGPSSGTARNFVLSLEGGDVTKPEGYAVEIGDNVTIRAATPAGVFYGTRTVLQLLRQDHLLPRGRIVDWPQYRLRMLMIDVARKPFPVPVLKDYLRMMAWYKMNELHLHLSDESRGDRYAAFRIESKKFPGLAARDLSYSWQDLRELQDFAKARGITITPEIDMPGHARCLLNYWPELGNPKLNASSLDVSNPKTAATMKALLEEMIPLFDAPDFHIGTDEYRMAGLTKEEREKFGEDFRKFINEMNAFVRSKGKNCRIWSGFEQMPGTTLPDPTVVVDMWVTRDAKALIDQGHKVINSSDASTYLVPGAHYYGVSNAGAYDSWEPWRIGGDAARNPSKDDPHLLGGKLHIWMDQGPAGYTMAEIADAAFPSLQVFAEKLWGTKGSSKFVEFQQCATRTAPVPGVAVFDRMTVADKDGLALDIAGEQSLSDTNATLALPLATAPRADLECPWTLTMDIRKTAETGQRGVILSSDLVEICSDFSRDEEKTTKGADGKETKTKVTRHGVGLVRAAGAFGKDPLDSIKSDQTSRVYSEPLPLDKWVTLTVVGQRGKTVVYLDGKKTGESNNQMVCPLRWLGSQTGHSFVGQIRNLKVYDREISPVNK